MPQQDQKSSTSRDALIQGLNEDLAREYQAVIAYVTYSKVLKGAEYMNIAAELEKHAGEELQHALTIAEQVDYLGGTPVVQPKPVKVTSDNKEMLRADLANEVATIQNYRQRIR
ncbi:MAG: ferritin-like domain-containing protein, partial [Candidatus Acidiferrum sp.]